MIKIVNINLLAQISLIYIHSDIHYVAHQKFKNLIQIQTAIQLPNIQVQVIYTHLI